MRRRFLSRFLIIIISLILVSGLFADKANQEKLEAKFRAETGFDGSVAWWDCDDTMKELQGFFPNMDVYFDDDEDYIASTMNDIMLALEPYIGLKVDSFFKPDVSYDFYVFPQMLNQMPIDRNGYVEIDMNDYDLSIFIYTLPNVKAPVKAEITKDQAFKLAQTTAETGDIDATSFESMYLTYISKDVTIIDDNKPTSLSLAWSVKGKANWYFIDAVNGTLLKKRSL